MKNKNFSVVLTKNKKHEVLRKMKQKRPEVDKGSRSFRIQNRGSSLLLVLRSCSYISLAVTSKHTLYNYLFYK